MFEINLVPDVKEQLLKKQRLRNFIIFVSIVVASASAGVVVLLGSIVGGQNIAMGGQDEEIQCRSEGPVKNIKCETKRHGVPVLKFGNLNEYLTIQDQMGKISALNDSKLLLSRVFGIMAVILPSYEAGDDDDVKISELVVDLPNATLSFEAQGDSLSNIDYRALLVFKDTVNLAYYDYGRYMRYDDESSGFVEIPTMCIEEMEEEGTGLIYGVYHKGAPGCEAPVLSLEQRENVPGATPGEGGTGDGVADDEERAQVTDIKINRIYRTEKEKSDYQAKERDGGRYYFESQCETYGEDGKLDEVQSREKCKLSAISPLIRDSSNGRDSDGNLVLRFSAMVTLNKEVFRFANKHMRVIGPIRQNVTDSYTQIRDMFKEAATPCASDDDECRRQQGVPNGD